MEALLSLQQRALRQLLGSSARISRQSFRQLSNSSRRHLQTRPYLSCQSNHFHSLSKRRPFHRFSRPVRRYQSTTSGTTPIAPKSLSQRLKDLSREYGWSALGVYLTLSALDFPFCFLAVRTLGADRIGHWEHVILSHIKAVVKWPLPQEGKDMVEGASDEFKGQVEERVPLGDSRDADEKRLLEEDHTYISDTHGYREAQEANTGENASLWTQLVLAYAIHKSFIFIRVPLTAAILPSVVKTLRRWGWNIGKRTPKALPPTGGKGTGVNTKGVGVKPDK